MAIPYEVVLNSSYAYFKMSNEALNQMQAMCDTHDTPSLDIKTCPLKNQLSNSRFDQKLIKVIKEMGRAASDEGSLLQIHRIHPLFLNYTHVKSRNGYEKLCFNFDAAMQSCLSEIKEMNDITKIKQTAESYLKAAKLQNEWIFFDSRQYLEDEDEEEEQQIHMYDYEESDDESEDTWDRCDEY
jgi:hypothetical protein